MASAPTLPFISVDEYLSTSYHPDVEYVDGVLVERGMPTMFHALLQVILCNYFRQFEKEFKFKTLTEARTQIVSRARYRIPDVVLCPTPMPKGRINDAAPAAVFEVLSPDDTVVETRRRFQDYAGIGVTALVQMDPEEHVAHRFEAGSLIETRFEGLYLPHARATVPFDSEAIFEQLRREHREATEG
jgi:Uma2 family endonuclease